MIKKSTQFSLFVTLDPKRGCANDPIWRLNPAFALSFLDASYVNSKQSIFRGEEQHENTMVQR